MADLSSKEIILKPNTRWIHIDLEGLIAYRDLIWLLIKRDFTSRYRQTILGPLWFFANPIITTLTFTLVFSGVIGISTDGTPPLLFFMSGTLGWNFFSMVLGGTSNSLAGNTHLFSKVYFPRLIPPLATCASSVFNLTIQLLTFLGFYAFYKWGPSHTVLPAPNLLWLTFIATTMHMAVLALGLGLLLSSVTAKYRDLAQIQGYLINLMMYATPVIYPLSSIPPKYQWLANINPMTAVVESIRAVFLGAGTVSPSQYAYSVLVSLLLFFMGIFAYQRAARTFVDTV